jgi:hypothetical protein
MNITNSNINCTGIANITMSSLRFSRQKIHMSEVMIKKSVTITVDGRELKADG